MKWFQHNTDAMYDIKMKRLRGRFGMIGYGVIWAIWETIGREGELGYLSFSKYPMSELATELRVDETQLKDMLMFMSELGLLDKSTLDREEGLMNLKMLEKGDDYSKRIQRKLEEKAGVRTNSEGSPSGVTSSIIYYYINKHKESVGVEYPTNWGKEGALIKDLLKTYTPETLKQFIDEFFEMAMDKDCWHADKCTIGVFKSQISKIIGSLRKKVKK